MAKKPMRTWAMMAALGIPLAIVGATAMAISYATLIDVARVNGLPLPELFPILIDVGTVATMIAASLLRRLGLSGRWLAYLTFVALSVVSIVANASHAGRAADLTVTTTWAAAILASTPPAALLAITHLVMMLIPDERERLKLQASRERAERAETGAPRPAPRTETARPAESPAAPSRALVLPAASAFSNEVGEDTNPLPVARPLRLVNPQPDPSDGEVRNLVLGYLEAEGKRPTGKVVGEWLGGKTSKTGQRFLKKMEDDGVLSQFDDGEFSTVTIGTLG